MQLVRNEQAAIDPERPDPKDLIEYHDKYQKAVLLHAGGKKEESLAMCLEIIAERPDFMMARIMAARELVEGGRYAEALTHSNAILTEAPENAQEYVYRAGIHEKLGDEEAALADYGRALALPSVNPSAYVKRAQLLARRGETAAAIDDLETALPGLPAGSADRDEAESLLKELTAEPDS